MDGIDYIARAKEIVREHVDKRLSNLSYLPNALPEYEVRMVWFSKNLQNWKALVGTSLPDKLYYELTHDGEKHVTYLDEYRKLANIVIPD